MLRTTMTLIAAMAATTPASARDHIWSVGDSQMHVIASGADMATPAGRAGLLKLVNEAATRLCRREPLGADQRACVETAIASAAATSPRPFLRLALAERGGVAIAAR